MSDYPSQGTPMDVEDHPAYNKPDATQKYAGDVVPIGTSVGGYDTHIRQAQENNKAAMSDIAKRGPSSVDTSNLTVFKPLRPGQ